MIISDFVFGRRSIENLKGVHPELVLVASRALAYSQFDFAITSGLRTREEQARLFEDGKSKTMNSRHLTGDAIDFMAFTREGLVTWDWEYYQSIAESFKRAAKELKIQIEWGGEAFGSFKDGPHIQRARIS